MALSSLYITLTSHMYKIKPNHSLTPTFFIKFPPFSHSIYFTIKYIMERITKLASQKAVVIFSKSSCGMSHAIKRLFYEQGVGPAIYELDEDIRGKEMEWALMRLGCNPSVPAVFVGGNFVGSANTVMTLHLNGSLKKMLRDAGALWL